MLITVLDLESVKFSLRGECPHCGDNSVFMIVGTPHTERSPRARFGQNCRVVVAVMRCQGCLEYILGIADVDFDRPKAWYVNHYPIGAPDDTVAEDVPEGIAMAFSEALRCRSVRAYSAAVLMCRRSLQVSCDLENAVGKDLFEQTADLFKKGRITEPPKKMATRIRLLGKRGAHGDYSDIDETITPQDADDAILFMSHYLEHVYVLPAKLEPPPANTGAP